MAVLSLDRFTAGAVGAAGKLTWRTAWADAASDSSPRPMEVQLANASGQNWIDSWHSGSLASVPAIPSPERAARCEICVGGVLGDRWAYWSGGLQVTSNGTQTTIVGLLADQPALHGLLAKIRDLGLCLIPARQPDLGETGTGAPQ